MGVLLPPQNIGSWGHLKYLLQCPNPQWWQYCVWTSTRNNGCQSFCFPAISELIKNVIKFSELIFSKFTLEISVVKITLKLKPRLSSNCSSRTPVYLQWLPGKKWCINRKTQFAAGFVMVRDGFGSTDCTLPDKVVARTVHMSHQMRPSPLGVSISVPLTLFYFFCIKTQD